MIYDFDTELTISPPVTTGHITYSGGVYDLLDTGGVAAGTAVEKGVPGLFGGGQLYMQLEVTTAFTVSGGAPLAQFGIAIGDTDPLDVDAHVLAMTGGSVVTKVGFDVGQLDTIGRTFHLAIPSWEDIMEVNGALWPDTTTAATLAAFRLFRYMGLVCVNPMDTSSDNEWVAGQVKGRITTQATVGTAVGSNQYPSRMVVL